MTYSPPKFSKAVLYKTIGGVSCDPYADFLFCIPFATSLTLTKVGEADNSFDAGELFTARLCPSPSANFICANFAIFFAAFISLSCMVLQLGHIHSLVLNGNLSNLCTQQLHVLLLGANLSI